MSLPLLTLTYLASASPTVWQPCPRVARHAACARVAVPVDHDRQGATLDLEVARIPGPSGSRGQVWFVPDGPGHHHLDAVAEAQQVHAALAADLDLLVLEMRGTGPEGLRCPEAEAPRSEAGHAITPAEWLACSASLDAADVAPFTTAQISRDLHHAIRGVRGEAETVAAWGVGYGAFVVDRLLEVDPQAVDAVILDRVRPADWRATDADRALEQLTQDTVEACLEDRPCREALGADPAAFAASLIDDVDEGYCERVGLDGDALRQLGAHLVRGGSRMAAQLPALWFRLDRCRPRDVRAVGHLLDALFDEERAVEAPRYAPVLARQITYADLWHKATDDLRLRPPGLASTGRSAALEALAPHWPHPLASSPSALSRVDLPILALHGAFDPELTLARASMRETLLDGAQHQHLVVVPGGADGSLVAGDSCVAEIARRFLLQPEAPLDTGCLGARPSTPAVAPRDGRVQDRALWGVPDRWGRAGCATAAGGGPSSTLAGVVLLLAVIGRRGKR